MEYNVELPGGTRLRRQTKPASVDGKSHGYKELRKHIAGLKKRNDHWGIFRKLRDLEQWEVTPPSLGGKAVKRTLAMHWLAKNQTKMAQL